MKRSDDRNPLLNDVFGENDELRAATLAHGVADMRKKRVRRRVVRVMGSVVAVAVVAVLIAGLQRQLSNAPLVKVPASSVAALPAQQMIEGTPIRVIGDEELLGIFEGRPVALAGARGERRLLLLDEPAPEVDGTHDKTETEGDEPFATSNGGS